MEAAASLPVEPDPLDDARELLEIEDQYWEAYHRDYAWQLRKAVLVSPCVDVCEALLRGEDVPASRLDGEWLQRMRGRA